MRTSSGYVRSLVVDKGNMKEVGNFIQIWPISFAQFFLRVSSSKNANRHNTPNHTDQILANEILPKAV